MREVDEFIVHRRTPGIVEAVKTDERSSWRNTSGIEKQQQIVIIEWVRICQRAVKVLREKWTPSKSSEKLEFEAEGMPPGFTNRNDSTGRSELNYAVDKKIHDKWVSGC